MSSEIPDVNAEMLVIILKLKQSIQQETNREALSKISHALNILLLAIEFRISEIK